MPSKLDPYIANLAGESLAQFGLVSLLSGRDFILGYQIKKYGGIIVKFEEERQRMITEEEKEIVKEEMGEKATMNILRKNLFKVLVSRIDGSFENDFIEQQIKAAVKEIEKIYFIDRKNTKKDRKSIIIETRKEEAFKEILKAGSIKIGKKQLIS